MRSTLSKWSVAALFCALAASLLAAPGLAQERPVVGSSEITYNPSIDYERAVLTLSGMDRVWQQTVTERGPVVFDLVGPEGEVLRDGDYTWEMRITPRPDGSARRGDAAAAGFGVAVEIPGLVHSGYFRIVGGRVALGGDEESGERGPADDPPPGQTRDQVILDDLIVDGSACIGQDCVNGESFGFDTLRLKENNLRIKFDDTSSTASFPDNDWQLTANDSSNGGAEKFSIDDISGGRTPFTIEAGAPSHSLYVDDGGRIGLGTATPVVEVHVVDGDSPTIRLEQDGSSGFTAQTWDLAGNETNFFIRDATNGSKLPFRIRPSAPVNSIYIKENGDIGMGTASPQAALHIQRNDAAKLLLEDTSATSAERNLLEIKNNGKGNFSFENSAAAGNTVWTMSNANNGVLAIDSIPASGANPTEFRLQQAGNLLISGFLMTATTQYPDYVFGEDYELMPLDELESFIEREGHLPNVLSADEVDGGKSVNMSLLQVQLLEKVEELTLYTLDQHRTIDSQRGVIAALEARLTALERAAQAPPQ